MQMTTDKAIAVAKNQIRWQQTGVPVPFEELNSKLLKDALICLVDIAEKELSEDAAWVGK